MDELITKQEAALLTGLSEHTLKARRDAGELILGIHWESINSRVIRYRRSMLQHWSTHRHVPEEHQIEIERFLNSQLVG